MSAIPIGRLKVGEGSVLCPFPISKRSRRGVRGDALISVIQPFSAKRKVALGREVEFRFSQWCCAFVFHWMQKGQFESQGRGGENGMGDARGGRAAARG